MQTALLAWWTFLANGYDGHGSWNKSLAFSKDSFDCARVVSHNALAGSAASSLVQPSMIASCPIVQWSTPSSCRHIPIRPVQVSPMSIMQAFTAATTPRPLGMHNIHLAIFAMVMACFISKSYSIFVLMWHHVILSICLDSAYSSTNHRRYPQRNRFFHVSNPLDCTASKPAEAASRHATRPLARVGLRFSSGICSFRWRWRALHPRQKVEQEVPSNVQQSRRSSTKWRMPKERRSCLFHRLLPGKDERLVVLRLPWINVNWTNTF